VRCRRLLRPLASAPSASACGNINRVGCVDVWMCGCIYVRVHVSLCRLRPVVSATVASTHGNVNSAGCVYVYICACVCVCVCLLRPFASAPGAPGYVK